MSNISFVNAALTGQNIPNRRFFFFLKAFVQYSHLKRNDEYFPGKREAMPCLSGSVLG